MISNGSTRARRGTRSYVRFSAKVARAICARVASGETVAEICREPQMPHQCTVGLWARTLPTFAKALSQARAVSERRAPFGTPTTYSAAVAQEFYERVCEGESVIGVCRDPHMPSFSAFYRWRRHIPEFRRLMAEARAIQAERFCEMGWEIAQEVTPQTAYATHVKLGQLRWTAGMLAPRKYGRTKAVELDADSAGGDYVVIVKRFSNAPLPDGTVLAPGEMREVRREPLRAFADDDPDGDD